MAFDEYGLATTGSMIKPRQMQGMSWYQNLRPNNPCMFLIVAHLHTVEDPNAFLKWGTLYDLWEMSKKPEEEVLILNALDLPMGDVVVEMPSRYM